MKKVAVLAMSLLAAVVSYGQGTVNFANAGVGLNSPVTDSDTTTRLSGARYMAELLAGTSAGSLVAVGSPTAFLTAAGAGFFNGGVITIASVAPGAVGTFQVRAWDTTLGATYAAALATGRGFGSSAPFTVTTGGVGVPASSPATLVGLTPFSLQVPEPSTYALLALGGAAMFFRRRK